MFESNRNTILKSTDFKVHNTKIIFTTKGHQIYEITTMLITIITLAGKALHDTESIWAIESVP